MTPVPGSKVCSCPPALITFPTSSCLQTGVVQIHGSSSISSSVALFLGLTSSILPIIALLSLGKRRSRRQGPLMTSCFTFGVSGRDPDDVDGG